MVTALPRRGILNYFAGLPGFYVVNPKTNIAVTHHKTREQAQREADERNRAYPEDPLLLVVVEIEDA